MKPGCAIHPLKTGFRLYMLSILDKTPIKIWLRRFKHDIEELVNAGARHIELVDDVIQFIPDFTKKFCKEMEQIGRYVEEFEKDGVTLSIHVAHVGYSVPHRFGELTAGTVVRFKNMVEYYKPLNPSHYTLHLGVDQVFHGQVFKDATSRRVFVKKVGLRPLAVKQILRQAPTTFQGIKEAGVDLRKIYIENSEGMTRKEFDALFNPLSKMFSELGGLLDTGHLLVEEYSNNEYCLEDFVEHWGKEKKKLKAVHIHDVFERRSVKSRELLMEAVESLNKLNQRFKNVEGLEKVLSPTIEKINKVIGFNAVEKYRSPFDDHQSLGTKKGVLDLPAFLKILKSIDFQGPIIYEPGVHNYKKAPESVKFLAKEIEKIKKSK